MINVPVKAHETYQALPDCQNVILVRLKEQLSFRRHFFLRYITTKVLSCFRIPKVEQPIIVEISINELEKSLIEKSNSTEESENESQANTPTNNTYDDEEFAKLRIENSQNYSN